MITTRSMRLTNSISPGGKLCIKKVISEALVQGW